MWWHYRVLGPPPEVREPRNVGDDGAGPPPRRLRLQRRPSTSSAVSGHVPCTLTLTGMSRTQWGGQAAQPRETVHRRLRIPAMWTPLPSCSPRIRGAMGRHPQGGATGTQVRRWWRQVLEKQSVERRPLRRGSSPGSPRRAMRLALQLPARTPLALATLTPWSEALLHACFCLHEHECQRDHDQHALIRQCPFS